MTAEILKKSGFKTGLFTSPYLEVFNERIRINGENITDNDLAEYVTRVKAIMEKNNALVSEFAFITAVSFLYFYEKQCDIVVLEVGMGGKLDATNVIVLSALYAKSVLTTRNISATLSKKSLKKNAVLCVTAAQPFHIRTMM